MSTTFRTRVAAIAVALGLTGAVLVGTGTAAQAAPETKWSECQAGGDILTGWTEFDFASQNTIYVRTAGFNIERNSGKHNNVYLRLRGNGGNTTYWPWTSGDNIVGGRNYTVGAINKRIPRGAKPYMKYHATFDQSGADPECAAYGHLGW